MHVLTILTCVTLLTAVGCKRITLFPTGGTMTCLGSLSVCRLAARLPVAALVHLDTTTAFHALWCGFLLYLH